MSQHFLLSAKARSLSLKEIIRMSDDQARATFRAIRFAETAGEPVCPVPECDKAPAYELAGRHLFKCKKCSTNFSLTSKTLFASRKMSIRDILTAIALFVNGANGVSALRMSRELQCDYKTAYVLLHKLRETMASMRTPHKLTGLVDLDGKIVGGKVKKPNSKAELALRKKEREAEATARERSIVTIRERRPGGRSLTFVVKNEADAVPFVLQHVDRNADLRTDMGSGWSKLGLFFPNHRDVNHSIAYMIDGIHINAVEGANSRYRRAEIGVHHHIWGPYLPAYADEMAWRDDHRRVSNGVQYALVGRRAATLPVSRAWKGYWQRRKDRAETSPTGAASLGE